MNVDQVVQLLIPPVSAPVPSTLNSVVGSTSRKIERRSVPRPGQRAWPPTDAGLHDVWRAVDSHQHMHDLFLMALLSTHTEPRRISGQFRALLERLARSTSGSALDPTSLVAVRRSAMRFDRILQIVTSAADAPPPVDSDTPQPEALASRHPRAAAARAAQRSVRTQSPNVSVDNDG
jgi:hypothetical protein